MQGLTNETTKGVSVVSENYDLLHDSTALSWSGNIININKPSGLSEIQNINFRAWTGEMLPFTKQELPALKCDVTAITKTITSANIDGEANPWGRSRFVVSNLATSNVISFTKEWTYNKDEDSQIIYNLNECVNMANDRIKTIFPRLDNAYTWTIDGPYHALTDKTIHLSRANAGSGAVGLISKNSNQVQIYSGNTTYPLDVDFTCTSTMGISENTGVRQCFSNYNNSIVIIDGADMWKHVNSQSLTRYNIFFNPNTEDTATFNETSTWTYGNSIPITGGRRNGSVFAIVRDEDDKAYNAVMTSAIYSYTNLVLSGPTLWVADPTATNKYRKVTITKSDWVDFLTNSPLALTTSSFCQVLAFNTIYDDSETKLYLYCLCITTRDEWSSQAYYILFKCEVDIINETHGSLEFIASKETTANDFKASLAYYYQYGADVGEMMTITDDDVDYYNFGFKYACKVDGTTLDIKVIHSSINWVDKYNRRLVYLCETKTHDGQSIASVIATSPKVLYDNGGIDAESLEPHLHAYYTLCERTDISDPYDCDVKGLVRNMGDEFWNWNGDVLYALNTYYLGSNNEQDTVKDINAASYVDMSLASSTPSASIWNAITKNTIEYASVASDFSDYYTASFSYDDGQRIAGQGTRPTLILKDSDDVYYQISYVLRIYTNPYYFEIYTDAHDYIVPIGSHSLTFGPVNMMYNQVNAHVLNTLEMLITLRYEFNDIALRCLNFPSYDNIVFNIGEITRIDFKKLQTTTSLSRLQFQIVDSSGNIIDRESLATLYGSLVLSLDWCY